MRLRFTIALAIGAATALAEKLPHHYANPGRLSHHVFQGKSQWQRRTRQLVARAEQQVALYSVVADNSGIISPLDFGGDPTGQTDSTPAFSAAVAHLITLGGGRKNGANQTDLGGATLSLGGGVWAVSAPIMIPEGYANYRIHDGTIIAHPSFNTGEQALIMLGGECGGATAGLSKNWWAH